MQHWSYNFDHTTSTVVIKTLNKSNEGGKFIAMKTASIDLVTDEKLTAMKVSNKFVQGGRLVTRKASNKFVGAGRLSIYLSFLLISHVLFIIK